MLRHDDLGKQVVHASGVLEAQLSNPILYQTAG